MKKITTDIPISLCASLLKKYDYFTNRRVGTIAWTNVNTNERTEFGFKVFLTQDSGYIEVKNTISTNALDVLTQIIGLCTTSCALGGKRYWFICPAETIMGTCGKRVGILYFLNNKFACRNCHDLTYRSRNRGGMMKYLGCPITDMDLEKAKLAIKRMTYKQQKTKAYKRYLKMCERSDAQIICMANFIRGMSI